MKILVIGDSRETCARLTDILARHGCHVVHCGNRIAGERPDSPSSPIRRLVRAHRFHAVIEVGPCAVDDSGRAAVIPPGARQWLGVRSFHLSSHGSLEQAVGRMLRQLNCVATRLANRDGSPQTRQLPFAA